MKPCDGPHHYIFETPHDGLRYVVGICKKCGAEKVGLAGFEEDPVKRSKPKDSLFVSHGVFRRNLGG